MSFTSKRIQIKDLKVGQKIKTRDPKTGEICYREVTDKWDTIVPTHEQVSLTFTNGITLECSVNHPIMVYGSDMSIVEKKPLDLTPSDMVVTDHGITYLTDISRADNPVDYIDITVEDLHTFFASASETGHMVLTHNSQGGVRGGAANLNYPMWHLEFEKLIVLKNNKGVEENRIRQLDYTVQINRLMLERLRDDDYITLFSPDIDGGQLYLDYFDNPERFKARYEELEKNPVVRKKRIKASDLFGQLGQERTGTGRIYVQFVDNVNAQGPYIEPIRMTNLCVEICLPTTPVGTPDAEISLCTLSAYNLGLIEGYDDFLKVARAAVRGLDNLLDYQDYPVEEALKAKLRRSLGMGVTNFAYFLAKNYVKYSDGSANKLVHRTFEMMQFANLVASMELAKERGASEWHYKTRWAQGQLPIDWYNKNVDKLVPNDLQCDWEWLRSQIKEHGLRNDTLSALMPCESSSQLTNSTNGIEPPRSLVSVKSSKDGVFNQVVPEIFMLGDEYETAWAMTKYGMKGYLSLVAIMQKFVDQGISANTYSDPSNTGGKISMETVLEDLAFCSHYGIKSLYYSNVRDGADGSEESKSDCDSCKV